MAEWLMAMDCKSILEKSTKVQIFLVPLKLETTEKEKSHTWKSKNRDYNR